MESAKDLSPVEEQDKHILEEGERKSSVYEIFKTPSKFQVKHKPSKGKRKYSQSSPENRKEDKRPRTPSGQVLSRSVSDIKNQLESESGKVKHGEHVRRMSLPLSVQSTEEKESVIRCYGQQSADSVDSIEETDQSGIEELIGATGGDNCVTYQQFIANLKMDQTEITEMPRSETNPSTIAQKIDDTLAAINKDCPKKNPTLGNPEVMDVRVIASLLQNLKVDLQKEVQKEIRTDPVVMNMQKKMHLFGFNEKVVIDAVSKMGEVVKEMQDKLEVLESNNAKRMLIFTGFQTAQKKKIARQQIQAFLQEEVQTDARCEDFYYIGTKQPRDIVLIFASESDKHSVLRNKTNIKSLVNAQGKKFYFNEYQTTKRNEMNKQLSHVREEVKQAGEEAEVYVKQGKIYVGDAELEMPVKVPNPLHLLQLPMTQLNSIMAMKVESGTQKMIKGNVFTGYTICANKPETIQDAYAQIKLNHADARHIVCAWRVPGVKTYISEGYCDDDEYGIGLQLLTKMKESDVRCRAVFVVRKCGEKLFSDRLQSYLECAAEAISKNSANLFTKKADCLYIGARDEPNKTYATVVKSPPAQHPHSDRGGRRNRGGGGGYRSRGRGYSSFYRGRGKKSYWNNNNKPETEEKRLYTPKTFEEDDPKQGYTSQESVD